MPKALCSSLYVDCSCHMRSQKGGLRRQEVRRLWRQHPSHVQRVAVDFHPLIMSWPQYDRLSMCSRSSSHVITPGVESGATKSGQPEHFGYAPTSLHMSSHTPASLFCNWALCL